MSARVLEAAITRVVEWFEDSNLTYCLVGGLAVSFRTIERATRDIDFAVSVDSDRDAEVVVRSLQQIGFHPAELMQRKETGAIATVRLLGDEFPGVYVDLLFSASGIEAEVVATASPVELLPGLRVQAATIPGLIAMKVLSSGHVGRRQDLVDLDNLIRDASPAELTQAQHLVALICQRGFSAGRDLQKILAELVSLNRAY